MDTVSDPNVVVKDNIGRRTSNFMQCKQGVFSGLQHVCYLVVEVVQ